MSRTLRRKPWYPKAMADSSPKRRWRKVQRDSTCRSGCAICGKDKTLNRITQKRIRRAGKVEGQGGQLAPQRASHFW